jgi:hypothetical protein
MRERGDPLVPVLGAAVAAVVTGAVLFVFYPRVERALRGDGACVPLLPQPRDARVPVWVCRSVEGVALLVEPFAAAGSESALDDSLRGGPHHLLRLFVCNFAGPEAFTLDLPPGGVHGHEGGTAATPVAALLREGLPPERAAVLRGLGAVMRLEVARGRQGQALLASYGDPRARPALVIGTLRFERREVALHALASWRNRPDWDRFRDF